MSQELVAFLDCCFPLSPRVLRAVLGTFPLPQAPEERKCQKDVEELPGAVAAPINLLSDEYV